jgi:hypothetical protein
MKINLSLLRTSLFTSAICMATQGAPNLAWATLTVTELSAPGQASTPPPPFPLSTPTRTPSSTTSSPIPGEVDAHIDTVFFAQTHVMQPSDPLFKLVAHRQALIKAHIISAKGSPAPSVYAVLNLKGNSLTLKLDGPSTLPVSVPKDPG